MMGECRVQIAEGTHLGPLSFASMRPQVRTLFTLHSAFCQAVWGC